MDLHPLLLRNDLFLSQHFSNFQSAYITAADMDAHRQSTERFGVHVDSGSPPATAVFIAFCLNWKADAVDRTLPVMRTVDQSNRRRHEPLQVLWLCGRTTAKLVRHLSSGLCRYWHQRRRSEKF